MNKMRILHIVTDLDRGGVEKQMIEVIRALPNLDHHIFSLLGDGPLFSEIENTNITLASQKNPLKLLREIRSLIKEIRPDVIQTWMFHSDLLGGLAAVGTGVPVVWSYHASKLPKESLKKKTHLVIRTLGLLSSLIPKKIITCGSSAFEAALSNGYPKKKLEKINNGIDTDYYVPSVLDYEKKERVVVLPARWHVHKGHTVLLEAWHLLKTRSTPGRLLLMGQDMNAENQELNELILGYGLEKTVFPIGEISDMRDVYQNADIVVFSSLTEATPLALCEAMSCGLVPIVTDVGDMKKMIGKSGIVCEAGNAKELSSALERILLSNDLEIRTFSKLAREEIIENYDLKLCASKYESIWSVESST